MTLGEMSGFLPEDAAETQTHVGEAESGEKTGVTGAWSALYFLVFNVEWLFIPQEVIRSS